MTANRLTKMFHVNPERITFTPSENGKYSVSESAKGCYILEQNGNYSVVSESTNSIVQFGRDLSELEY